MVFQCVRTCLLPDTKETFFPAQNQNRRQFISRSRQDSSLRGETPMDFESIALTTRPRLPCNGHQKIDINVGEED